MGFWKKLGGYAMMVGGAVAAPYTGGASLALVGAGANMVSNDIKSEASEKAAGEQIKAADKAIGTQQAGMQEARAAYAPYTSTGSAAMGTLGGLMGLPTMGANTMTGGQSLGALPANMQAGLGMRPDVDVGANVRYAIPRDSTASTPQARAQLQSQSSYTPTLGGMVGGGLVQMRAPTGEVSWVSPEQVPFFQSRGATAVN